MLRSKKVIALLLAMIMILSFGSIGQATAENADVIADSTAMAVMDAMDASISNTSDEVEGVLSFDDAEVMKVIPANQVNSAMGNSSVQSAPAPRAQADITSYPYGNTTNTPTNYDVLFFSLPSAKELWVRLSTTNANYNAYIGYTDASGNIYLTTAKVNNTNAFGRWQLDATTAANPYWCIVMMSNTTYGTPYTLYFNKATDAPAVGTQVAFVSSDFETILTRDATGKKLYNNGKFVINLENEQLGEWEYEWLVDLPGGPGPGGGYNKTKVRIECVHVVNQNGKPMIGQVLKNYNGKTASQSSTYAVAVPIDVNTLWMDWRWKYDPALGYSVQENYDLLGNYTPTRLTSYHFMDYFYGPIQYAIVDLQTGKIIDLYGNLNRFYRVEFFPLPTYGVVSGVHY